MASPFSQIRVWRAADRHTGIGKDAGIPYTYEHVPTALKPRADIYRVETFIPFVRPTPIHRNIHYVPGDRLDAFFDYWSEHTETVVDIRPLTNDEAIRELEQFRAQKGGV